MVAAAIVDVIITERCIVTLNPMLPDENLANDIRALKAPVILALAEDWARSEVRAAALESQALYIELPADRVQSVRVLQPLGDNEFRVDAQGVGIEMLTSGTTGTPKRIPLESRNFARMILDAAVFESRTAGGIPPLRKSVAILNTPFSQIGGLFGLFTCLSAGRRACMLDRFQVEPFVDAIERHRPKTVSAPPSGLRMILDVDVPEEKLASLVVFRTGAEPLDPDLAEALNERYGIPVLQNYGATEFAGGVAGWTLQDFKDFGALRRGSVGRMNPGVEGGVLDAETGEPAPFGQSGLLELRGSHLGDGTNWMRSNDIARMDAENFLWILGRADNAIIRGGFKIIPNDVVRATEPHPAVRKACVIAQDDPRLGEEPVAAHLVKTEHLLAAEDLRVHLRQCLAPYQVPVRLMQLAEMPRTPSMKVS
ncbi:long-chain fatty acid--CoA ligase [Novosphingobium sp. ERN07]|uniref:ANL family adenylate-forming protein n=1 Tax=Novosphingobium sp. ERN07 TaxID=2726187 RepID=UPI001457449B|nr:fatty acid--CoA ligase family protein [Novosphingobium sp. ERN07]NLR73417.1 long-chain fatty acid--CoA ligase [Novosphingobium sp. ERN07]